MTEYKTCPNCGKQFPGWKTSLPAGSELPHHAPLAHRLSLCCGCSEEYLARLEKEPRDSFAVKLAEYERMARMGLTLSSPDTLALIQVLRGYMAHAVEVRRRVDEMMDVVRR